MSNPKTLWTRKGILEKKNWQSDSSATDADGWSSCRHVSVVISIPLATRETTKNVPEKSLFIDVDFSFMASAPNVIPFLRFAKLTPLGNNLPIHFMCPFAAGFKQGCSSDLVSIVGSHRKKMWVQTGFRVEGEPFPGSENQNHLFYLGTGLTRNHVLNTEK